MSESTTVLKTPLDDAREQLADAIKILGYDEGMYAMLATPRRETTVSIPLRRDSGDVELIIGHRVQHSLTRGPGKGGLRYSPEHDIPAPDIGTDEQTMAWMMDTYSVNKGHTELGVVTGKPISLGGSLGRASTRPLLRRSNSSRRSTLRHQHRIPRSLCARSRHGVQSSGQFRSNFSGIWWDRSATTTPTSNSPSSDSPMTSG